MTSSDRDDREERDVCELCGARVSASTEAAFAFGAGGVLCFECATRRGGSFDADRDLWDPPPDLEGLPDEAYGTAPHEIRKGRS